MLISKLVVVRITIRTQFCLTGLFSWFVVHLFDSCSGDLNDTPDVYPLAQLAEAFGHRHVAEWLARGAR